MKRLLLLAPLLLLLSGCILYPGQKFNPDQNAENLGGARFAQQQAVQGFDTSTYTLSDEQLEDFRDLLVMYDIDPGDYRSPEPGGCTGGITTRVQMWFHENGDKEMVIDGCGAPDGSFEQMATDFFSSVRDGTDQAFGNDMITGVIVRQEFPVSEFKQSDPTEVARFVAILDHWDIEWNRMIWVELETSWGDSCSGADTYEVSVTYPDGTESGPRKVNGCDLTDAFEDDATALFAEWAATG